MSVEIVKAELVDGEPQIWVESESLEELLVPQVRRMAYEKRIEMGMPQAGIDQVSVGPVGPDGAIADETPRDFRAKKFRRIFKLVNSPV